MDAHKLYGARLHGLRNPFVHIRKPQQADNFSVLGNKKQAVSFHDKKAESFGRRIFGTDNLTFSRGLDDVSYSDLDGLAAKIVERIFPQPK